MTTSCLKTGQRTGLFTSSKPWVTQAAVTDDILRCAPAPVGELPVTVPLLLTALANHDGPTYVHSLRVAQLSWWLTHAQDDPLPACQWAFMAGLLHDVGKIHIPRSLLQKVGSLTGTDSDILHTHATHGAQLVRQHVDVAAFAPIIAAQYERPDGWGTPKGLQAPQIPTTTYVIAVAEALDTLVNPPCGTLPASVDAICDTLLAGAGCRWDTGVAKIAAQLISRQAATALDPALTHAYVDDRLLVA
jgi:HD-GYP domain-containing protein (c-di-GMP phosphodiesterase class II)